MGMSVTKRTDVLGSTTSTSSEGGSALPIPPCGAPKVTPPLYDLRAGTPAWRNWQRTCLVNRWFPVQVRASALPEVTTSAGAQEREGGARSGSFTRTGEAPRVAAVSQGR